MEIFKLFGSIFVDTTETDKKLEKTNKKGKSIGETLGNGIKTVGKWGAAIVGAATTAGAAIVGMATKTASNCDEIDKMSQKLGLSRKAYQEWSYILSQNGADINSLSTGMKTLTASMDKVTEGNATAKANFDRLGLSVYDNTGKLKSQEQMFEETVVAMQGMEDGTEKARLATELFGKQGQELMPLLNGEAGSVEELKQKAHDLGMVLSDETVNAGVSFTDTMDTLKRAGQGLFNVIGGAVMPIVEKFANLIINNMPTIQNMIGQFTPIFTQVAESVLPPLMQLGQTILPIIFDVLQTLTPIFTEIISTILPVIVQLIQMLLPPIVQIVQEILPIFVQLIQAILPLLQPIIQLLQPIIDLFMALLEPLLSLINLILPPIISLFTTIIQLILPPLQAGLELIANIVSGVFKGAFELISNIIKTTIGVFQGIIDFIKNIFVNGWSNAFNTVKNIFSNIFNAIGNIINNVKNIFSGIINFIKNTFVAAWQGAFNTVKNIFSTVFNTIQNVINNIKNIFSNIINFVKNVFAGNWSAAWQNIKNIFSNVISGIANIFKAPINLIINGINAFIRGINKIKIPDWVPGIGGMGFHINELPRLKVGIDYVPEDDYPAVLHKGERVLTKEENAEYMKNRSKGQNEHQSSNVQNNENNSFTVKIENFYNNTKQDIQALSEEMAFYFYGKKRPKGAR